MPVPAETLARDYWHLLAHRSELAQSGDYVRLPWVLGEIVVHNDEGEIIAFDNVCPHRGGRFFVEDRGTARAICPYHGWSVRGGEVRVTRRAEFSACDLARAVLNRYRTAWCGDWLFAAVAPVMSLEDQLDAFAPQLCAISQDIAAPRDLYRIDFEADWRVAVENALEAYHVNSIHPDTLAPLGLCEDQDSFAGLNSAYHGRIGEPRAKRGLQGLSRFFDLRAQFQGYCTYYIFPFAMVSSTYGYSYSLQNFLPRAEPHRSGFYSRLFASHSAAGAESVAETLLAATVRANRQIFDEDHAICRRVSRTYDMDAPDRIYAASEARLRALAEQLRGIEAAQAAARRLLQRAYMAR